MCVGTYYSIWLYNTCLNQQKENRTQREKGDILYAFRTLYINKYTLILGISSILNILYIYINIIFNIRNLIYN